jgi:cysteinyl-tRNA synthetase
MGGQEKVEILMEQLGADAKKVFELGSSFVERFHAAVDHDFNTAQGLGYLFDLARAVNRFANHKKAERRGGPVVAPALRAFALVREAFGLMAMDTGAFHEEVKTKRLGALGLSREQVEDKITARAQARQAKDWATADAIRQELTDLQIEVLDLAGGVEWRVRLASPAE